MHNTFRLFYYSPRNTFINLTKPEGSWYTKDSIYKDMELSPADRQISPPDSFYVYTPPAQKEVQEKKQNLSEVALKEGKAVEEKVSKNGDLVVRNDNPPVVRSDRVPVPISPVDQVQDDTVRSGLYNPGQDGERVQASDPLQLQGGKITAAGKDGKRSKRKAGGRGGAEGGPEEGGGDRVKEKLQRKDSGSTRSESVLPGRLQEGFLTPSTSNTPQNHFNTSIHNLDHLNTYMKSKKPPSSEVQKLKTRTDMTPLNTVRNRPASNFDTTANNLSELNSRVKSYLGPNLPKPRFQFMNKENNEKTIKKNDLAGKPPLPEEKEVEQEFTSNVY